MASGKQKTLRSIRRSARLAGPALLLAIACVPLIDSGTASAQTRMRSIHYRGDEVRAPASWPVYRLADDPSRCVRLDRKAVYLGRPARPSSAARHTRWVEGRRS